MGNQISRFQDRKGQNRMIIDKSRQAFQEAQKLIPGGVNSPVRAFKSVGGNPLYIDRGEGAFLTDIDGNRYMDFLGSWGPLILGHAHPEVTAAVKSACDAGMSFGAPTVRETLLAQQIARMVPSMEKVRLVSSGTEATMTAIRLARGFTKRNLIIKFDGCYHGHGDSFLIAAGSGVATLGIPDSPGVTPGTAADTLVARYNDLDSVKALFKAHKGAVAAVIVEPVAGNMGVIPPEDSFLQGLRKITEDEGSLLIIDEVMTGFRVARGGAQEKYGIKPDISTFGKIIGGGMPLAAYGGRAEIMDHIAPSGSIYQAGTLSGNPLATAAGLATLEIIDRDPSFYTALEERSAALAEGLLENCRSLGIPALINRAGSMMTLFFTDQKKVANYDDARRCDAAFYGSFFRGLLEEGIYMAPSAFEAAFVSAVHSSADIQTAVSAAYRVLKSLKDKQSS